MQTRLGLASEAQGAEASYFLCLSVTSEAALYSFWYCAIQSPYLLFLHGTHGRVGVVLYIVSDLLSPVILEANQVCFCTISNYRENLICRVLSNLGTRKWENM